MRLLPWSVAPEDATPTQRENFLNVQLDAIGVGLASAASAFLPVLLTRLGASSFQVGLLTAMPSITGFFLSVAVGRFLRSHRDILRWWNGSRLIVFSSYALMGLILFVVPRESVVQAELIIWALLTVPRTVIAVAFSVVMNAVAGPRGRYELMSRRWSLLGLTTSISVAIVGLVLDRLPFPLNYQLVFVGLSFSGWISYYYGSRIRLLDSELDSLSDSPSFVERIRSFVRLIGDERAFVSFATKRFIYTVGLMLATPIFPLYYVRAVQATDAWIGAIHTAQTAFALVGYHFWTQQSRKRGARFVLLFTAFGLACYPALTATTRQVEWIALLALLGSVFQAGLDLVFFDELMKTVPPQHSAAFIAVATSLQHFSTAIAPLLGTLLADWISLSAALVASTALRLLGFGLFSLSIR